MTLLHILAKIGAAGFFVCLLFTPIIFMISVGEGAGGLLRHTARAFVGMPTFAVYLAGVPEPTAKIIGPVLLAFFTAGLLFTLFGPRKPDRDAH